MLPGLARALHDYDTAARDPARHLAAANLNHDRRTGNQGYRGTADSDRCYDDPGASSVSNRSSADNKHLYVAIAILATLLGCCAVAFIVGLTLKHLDSTSDGPEIDSTQNNGSSQEMLNGQPLVDEDDRTGIEDSWL